MIDDTDDAVTEACRLGVLSGVLIATCDVCGCPADYAEETDGSVTYECVAHGPRSEEQAQFWDADTWMEKAVVH